MIYIRFSLRQKFSDLKLQFVNLKSLNFIAEIVWIYVLLFQILEAVVIGTCWYKKNMHIMRYILTVVLLTFLLKPFSYLFYYLFNRANMGEKSFGSYIMEMYRNYLSLGWKDTILLYATGIFAAYIIMRGIDIITKREREEKK